MTRYTVIKGISPKDQDINKSIKGIVNDLHKYGRAKSTNSSAVRRLRHLVKPAMKKGWIYFANMGFCYIIALAPGAKLKKTSNRSVDISYESPMDVSYKFKTYKEKLYKQ